MNNPSSPSEDTLWTTDSVAHYLQVSRKTIYNLRHRGLPCKILGGAVRFDPQEVKDYLKKDLSLTKHGARRSVRKNKPQDKDKGGGK